MKNGGIKIELNSSDFYFYTFIYFSGFFIVLFYGLVEFLPIFIKRFFSRKLENRKNK